MPAVLATVLAYIARYLVIKLIAAFGIAFVTGGVSAYLLTQFKDIILTQLSRAQPEAYNIMIIAGLGYALSIIFGAIAFIIALNAGKRIMIGVTGVGI